MTMKTNLLGKTILVGLAFGIFISSESAHAIRINGQTVNFTGDSEEITYNGGLNVTNISFQIKGEDITVGTLGDVNGLVQKSISIYEEIHAQYENMCGMIVGKSIDLQAATAINNSGAFLKAGEGLVCVAGNGITFKNSIAEIQGKVCTTSTDLDVQNFFLTTPEKVLFKGPEDGKSWLKGLEYSSASLETPFTYFMQGKLNLNTPSTEGHFVCVGAQTVTFHLRNR